MTFIRGLESRWDRWIGDKYSERVKDVEGKDPSIKLYPEGGHQTTYKMIRKSLKDSIRFKHLQYQYNCSRLQGCASSPLPEIPASHSEETKTKNLQEKLASRPEEIKAKDKQGISNRGEKLEKDLCEDIGLFEKFKERQRNELSQDIGLFEKFKERQRNELSQDIERLETNFALKMLSILFKYFPSNFNPKEGFLKTFLSNICSEDRLSEINQLSEKHNKILKIESGLGFLKEINEIREKFVEMKNDGQKLKIWKPQKLTKKSLIERLKVLGIGGNVINYVNKSDGNLYCKNSGLIKLSDDLDLIMTSDNNYYLVYKSKILGEGHSKTAYRGIDLSENQPIAILYAPSKTFKEEKDFIELKDELKDGEREGIGEIKDCLCPTSNADGDEIIFISPLYDKLPEIKNETIETKVQFCKEIFEAMYNLAKINFFPLDIKPSNILYKKENQRPVLIDLDREGYTSLYFPPEFTKNKDLKASNPSNPTQKSVIWSLGMTFYEIYCGSHLLHDIYSKEEVSINEWAPICYIFNLTEKEINDQINKQIEKCPNHESHRLFLEMIRSMLKINPEERATFHEIIIESQIMQGTKPFFEEVVNHCVKIPEVKRALEDRRNPEKWMAKEAMRRMEREFRIQDRKKWQISRSIGFSTTST